VPLIVDQPVAVTLSFAEKKGLKVVVKMPEAVKAPIKQGQEVGKLVVSVPGLPDEEYSLKTAAAVDRQGFFPRIGMVIGHMLGGGPEAPKPEAAAEKKKEAVKSVPRPIPPSSAARKMPVPDAPAAADAPKAN